MRKLTDSNKAKFHMKIHIQTYNKKQRISIKFECEGGNYKIKRKNQKHFYSD